MHTNAHEYTRLEGGPTAVRRRYDVFSDVFSTIGNALLGHHKTITIKLYLLVDTHATNQRRNYYGMLSAIAIRSRMQQCNICILTCCYVIVILHPVSYDCAYQTICPFNLAASISFLSLRTYRKCGQQSSRDKEVLR